MGTGRAKQIARIRRTSSMPEFAVEEARQRRRYPHTLNIKGLGVTLAYRASGEVSVGEVDRGEEYHDAVLRRELFCWLRVGRQRVGAMALNTYCFSGCASNSEILDTMDIDQAFEWNLAKVLCNAWRSVVFDVSHMAPVLYFHMAWISPRYADGKLFAVAANELIEAVDDYSILVMKAFPLEYEGQAPPGSSRSGALRSRQRAMVRYYQRIFGVRPFPGRDGGDGWLWRPHPLRADAIRVPSRRRRER